MIQKIKELYKTLLAQFRLWRICKRLAINPYPWQKEFILGQSNNLWTYGRQTGKTTAVLLRLLVERPVSPLRVSGILAFDPDWDPKYMGRIQGYNSEYRSMCLKCRISPVHDFTSFHFCGERIAIIGNLTKVSALKYRCSVCGETTCIPYVRCTRCKAAYISLLD
ncbi:hypothetical protein AALC17_05235 [Oscillospiraceae bacterium 38-13]